MQSLRELLATITRPGTTEEKVLYYVKQALDTNPSLINDRSRNGVTLLHTAAKHGYLNVVKYLLELGADASAKCSSGKTLLHYVVKSGQLTLVKYLIDEGWVDVNVLDNQGKSPLYYSTKHGYLDIAKCLLEKFAIKNGYTPLHWAAENGSLDIVKFLINEKKFDVDIRDRNRYTPLHYASQHGRLAIVKYLIDEEKADLNVKSKYGESVVYLATKNNHPAVVKYLRSKDDSILKDDHTYTSNRFDRKIRSPKAVLKVIGTIIDIAGIAIGIKDIMEVAFGMFPDKQSEEFEKVLDAIGKNYSAIEEFRNKDRNFDAMEATSKVVSKILSTIEATRAEMRGGIKLIIESTHELKVGDKISGLTTFIDDFTRNQDVLRKLSPNVRVTELERSGGMLDKLRVAVTSDGILHGNLYHIINQKLAIPGDAEDNAAFATFHILYYGVQTYVSGMFFAIEQYSYLADFYYQKGDIVKCNGYLDLLQISTGGFKESLLSSGNKKQLIDKVVDVLKDVQSLTFIRNNRKEVFKLLQKRIDSLNLVAEKVQEMELPIVADQPEIIMRTPDFSTSEIRSPIGEWRNGAKVRYAIQYKNNNTYSKVGDWSDAFIVYDKANPFVKLPVDPQRRSRLIFRKFNDDQPKLVGVIVEKYKTRFRDINRDLYDAALNTNQVAGRKEFEVFLRNGADINETFEKGRRVIHAAAQRGNSEIATDFLLKNNVTDINARDNNGCTPIYIAAEAGYEKFVELLISKEADVNAKTDPERFTPLHISAFRGDVSTVEVLARSNKTDMNARDHEGFTALHRAVFGGTYVVNTLCQTNDTDVNAKSDEGLTPLHLASINDFEDIAEALVNTRKLDLNSEANGNLTALHLASSMGSLRVVKFLIAQNETNINTKSTDGWTALHLATFLKKEGAASVLLDVQDIEVNAKGKNDITPLHIATVTGKKNLTMDLLRRNATTEAQTKDGLTALHLSAKHNKHTIALILINNGANIEARTFTGSTPLHLAAVHGHNEIVLILMGGGADLKAINNDGRAPIHEAVHSGEIATVRIFIDRDLNLINLRTQDSKYLLHLAAQSGCLDIVKYLINEKGVDVFIQDENQYLPLHYAAKSGQLDIVRYLIDIKNGDFNVKGIDGKNSLHFAAENGRLDVVRYLIEEKQTDGNGKDYFNKTPAHYAAENGKLDILMYLDEKRVNMDGSDENRNRPMHLAAGSGWLDVVKYLVDVKHYEMNVMGEHDKCLLHFAAENGHLHVVAYLLDDKKVLVDALARYKKTALHFASENGHLEVIKQLIRKRADVNANMDRGFSEKFPNYSPLHFAAKNGHFEVVSYLVENNADVNEKCVDLMIYAQTPSDLAAQYGYIDIVRFLVDKEDSRAKEVQSETLRWAAVGGHLNVVKYILQRKGGEITTNKIRDAISWAAKNGHLDVIKYLLDERRSCVVDEVLPNAAEFGHLDVVKYFVEDKHIDINARNKDGLASLHVAVWGGHLELVRYLMDVYNINVNVKIPINREGREGTLDGHTPLHLAVRRKNLEMVRCLVENGADVNAAAAHNETPLHLITQINGRLDIVKHLVEKGADVNAEKDYGYTPLFYAVTHSELDVIKYLVENGANVNAQISYYSPYICAGCTPLQGAVTVRKRVGIAKYLIEQGAHENITDKWRRRVLNFHMRNNTRRCMDTRRAQCPRLRKRDVRSFEEKDDKTLRELKLAGGSVKGVLSNAVFSAVTVITQVLSSTLRPAMGTSHHDHSPNSQGSVVVETDAKSVLLLLDVLVRKVTGRRYRSASDYSIPVNEARGYALTITEKFERMLKEMARSCDVSPIKTSLNSFEVYKTVEGYVMSGELSKIPSALFSAAKDSCSKSKFEVEFLSALKENITKMLDNSN